MVEWGQISCFWHSKLNEVSGPVTTQGHVEVKTDDVTIGESKNHFLWNFLWILYFWSYSIIRGVKNLKIPTLMMPTMMVSTVTRVNSNKQKQQTNGKTTGDSDYQNNVSKSFSRNFENVRKWFCPFKNDKKNGEKKIQKWQKIFRRWDSELIQEPDRLSVPIFSDFWYSELFWHFWTNFLTLFDSGQFFDILKQFSDIF